MALNEFLWGGGGGIYFSARYGGASEGRKQEKVKWGELWRGRSSYGV